MEEKSIWRQKCGTASDSVCPLGTKSGRVSRPPCLIGSATNVDEYITARLQWHTCLQAYDGPSGWTLQTQPLTFCSEISVLL